jgi:two-component system chemotaxis response regulator CheY
MAKRVLSIGQCAADHAAISRLLEREFSAQVERADDARSALAKAREGAFDLVLVNRVLDLDGDDGLPIVREFKADPALADMPVMLVTNYAEHQARAVAAGAEPGFGKAALNSPATLDQLSRFLRE